MTRTYLARLSIHTVHPPTHTITRGIQVSFRSVWLYVAPTQPPVLGSHPLLTHPPPHTTPHTHTHNNISIGVERNRGIVACMRTGVVTCTSIMANGSARYEAIRAARAAGISLSRVGLHLNLTEGRPLSPPGSVPSLTGPDGLTFKGKVRARGCCAVCRV